MPFYAITGEAVTHKSPPPPPPIPSTRILVIGLNIWLEENLSNLLSYLSVFRVEVSHDELGDTPILWFSCIDGWKAYSNA